MIITIIIIIISLFKTMVCGGWMVVGAGNEFHYSAIIKSMGKAVE